MLIILLKCHYTYHIIKWNFECIISTYNTFHKHKFFSSIKDCNCNKIFLKFKILYIYVI